MTQISDIIQTITQFRDEREWKRFHNPKDMAISLSLEAAEVLEHFQWKSPEQIAEYLKSGGAENLGDELSDVLYWVLLLSHDLNIDLESAFNKKMDKNREKYPIEKSKGRSNKYCEL